MHETHPHDLNRGATEPLSDELDLDIAFGRASVIVDHADRMASGGVGPPRQSAVGNGAGGNQSSGRDTPVPVLELTFFFPTSGPVAQLGARMNGIHEVTGSIPVWSTNLASESSAGAK